MKKFIITEGERERILNLHKTRSSKQYLMEQTCANESPNFEPSNFRSHSRPGSLEFVQVGKSMEVPSGTYTLKPANVGTSNYYVFDSSGCWTGYILSGGREWISKNYVKKGEEFKLTYNGGPAILPVQMGDFTDEIPFGGVWEYSENKYNTSPNTDGPNSGKTIRSN